MRFVPADIDYATIMFNVDITVSTAPDGPASDMMGFVITGILGAVAGAGIAVVVLLMRK